LRILCNALSQATIGSVLLNIDHSEFHFQWYDSIHLEEQRNGLRLVCQYQQDPLRMFKCIRSASTVVDLYELFSQIVVVALLPRSPQLVLNLSAYLKRVVADLKQFLDYLVHDT